MNADDEAVLATYAWAVEKNKKSDKLASQVFAICKVVAAELHEQGFDFEASYKQLQEPLLPPVEHVHFVVYDKYITYYIRNSFGSDPLRSVKDQKDPITYAEKVMFPRLQKQYPSLESYEITKHK